LVQVRDCEPQLPQVCESTWPGVHAPSPVQALKALHLHVEPQLRCMVPHLVPQLSLSTVFALHSPSPAQDPNAPQVHALLHVREVVPQLPHEIESMAVGLHSPSCWHAPKAPQ
jgi:hypothetical protein